MAALMEPCPPSRLRHAVSEWGLARVGAPARFVPESCSVLLRQFCTRAVQRAPSSKQIRTQPHTYILRETYEDTHMESCNTLSEQPHLRPVVLVPGGSM